ncbi:hypothetical protein VitviT2T_013131 [Vitis vinifera]|uniref:Subtilisin-like protease SBT1.4 n=1 Tax=Vitis vinifera TaxID=29760 RepID=A0ABY9CIG0_VITVI|nr:hypothetical protein VitviT2T_013131 [Vitis vinifera]
MEIPSLLFFLLLLCLSLVSAAFSSNDSQNFIVHVSKSHKPTAFASHHQWYASIVQSLTSSTQPSRILYSYEHAATGFSARLTAGQASELRRIPGVLSVWPEQVHEVHTTHTPHFLGLANDSGLWPNSDYADDVIIGVLDTGIWPELRSFNDSELSPVPESWKGVCETGPDFPACNRKIIGARTFHRGYESALGRQIDESEESKSPRDTEGHGTHTASTAAGSVVQNASMFEYANGEARGMATKARIAVYKICWNQGCLDSDILAAMDQAIADGVHVISLSVGAKGLAPKYDRDSIAIGAFGAMEHGVIVSCSVGNSGPKPFTAVNIAPWILTVGASTIDREFPADVVLGNGRIFRGVSLYTGDPLNATHLPLVLADECGSRLCVAGKLNPSLVSGKIVVCDRGGGKRVEKGRAVKLAGGAGMILANTKTTGEELVADSHLIPATMVGKTAGDEIKRYADSKSSPTATIAFRGTVMGNSLLAPKVASFSSRGPNRLTPEILKPDVIAPGVNILAGWTGSKAPTDLDVDPRRVEFNIISGTSMSCPHVSGLAALLRKAYPKWTPAAIKSALMTTAYNLDNSGNNIADLATGNQSSPFIHGAGHVDPNRALYPGLVYDIDANDYISFLCAIGYDTERIAIFVRRHTTVDCNTEKLHTPGDLNYPAFSVVFNFDHDPVHQGNEIKLKRVVKNVGSSANAVYEVKVNPPEGIEVDVSPKKLVFSKENQTASYEVSFTSVESYIGSRFGSIEWSDGTHIVRSPVAVRFHQDAVSSI